MSFQQYLITFFTMKLQISEQAVFCKRCTGLIALWKTVKIMHKSSCDDVFVILNV